jgi:hypothetical protein
MSTDNTPPDWSKVKLSDEYNWTEGVSENGKPFKIGTPKSAGQPPVAEKDAEQDSDHPAESFWSFDSKVPFDISVNWPVTPNPQGFLNFHKPSAEETRITSITSFHIAKWPLMHNELNFTCTAAYNYVFYDATGDSYRNNVFWPRDGTVHIIQYFSSDSRIVRITGS